MLFIPIIFGIGIGAWIFNKMSHRTMSNQVSLIVALVVGIMAAIVFYTISHYAINTK